MPMDRECDYLEPDGKTCGATELTYRGRAVIPLARVDRPDDTSCPLAGAPMVIRRMCGRNVDEAWEVLRTAIGPHLPPR